MPGVGSMDHAGMNDASVPSSSTQSSEIFGRIQTLTVRGRRLARELHDGVAHLILVGLNDLDLFALYRRGGGSAKADAKLEHARDNLRDALEHVRALAAELAGVRGRGSDVRGEPPSPDGAARRELAVVLGEALRNALVHSGARTINVAIKAASDGITATVTDDGCGFDARPGSAVRRGMGLTSMAERIELAGGAFRVESSPRQHTRVSVTVPLREAGGLAPRHTAGR